MQEIEEGEAGSSAGEEGPPSGTLWPSRVNKQKPEKKGSELSSMWPSAKQTKGTEDTEAGEGKGGFASFWPSVKQDAKKKGDKKDVVLEDRDDRASGDSGDVDWLALPVAKPKEQNHFDPEKVQADEARRRSADRPFERVKEEDEVGKRPLRPFDEEPVGVHKKQPEFEQERP